MNAENPEGPPKKKIKLSLKKPVLNESNRFGPLTEKESYETAAEGVIVIDFSYQVCYSFFLFASVCAYAHVIQ